MAKCDLCAADCRPFRLEQLLDSYQTAGVVDLCPTCCGWANKLKSDMLAEIGPRMRAAIAKKKAQPALPWWKRLVG